MARPVKWRQIGNIPDVKNFIPIDSINGNEPKNVLKLEELEAIRLKDLEGLEQAECAENMQVSRPTFRRILLSAREKIADSLINGKAITIGGGNFTRNICTMRCSSCGYMWDESYENIVANKETVNACPKCGSNQVACTGGAGQNGFCRGRCRRRGRNG